MAWWNFSKEQRKTPVEIRDLTVNGDVLLQALVDTDEITVKQAMSIPAFASSVNLITNTVASLPIKLFKKTGEKTEVVNDDVRVKLLNGETGDTLDGFQFKKALVEDYLVYGAGYSFINKSRNKVKSLNYVENIKVSILVNPNPIFKRNDFLVYGGQYKDFEFIKLLRNTKNGGTGFGVVSENNKMLSVAYNTMIFEEMLVKTGGNKKGFLKSQGKLSPDAVNQLKQAWNNLYKNNTDNVVILNNGLEFQEANNSSVEMQINQNKITNANEIMQMFNIPVELLNGKATGGNEVLYDSFIKLTILPILKAFETALNRDLLLASEKGAFCFEFDTKDLLKGDIEKRFKAYEIAVANGILQIDEVRHIENYASLGLDFVKLNLADVLYNPITKEVYTPNTNANVKMGEGGQANEPANSENLKADNPNVKGGENKDESGNT